MRFNQTIPDFPSSLALELFQPEPNVFYSLDAAVHLAGVSRRSFLVYCRAGLVRPVFQPPYGVMEFTEDSIYTVRRMDTCELFTAAIWPGSTPCRSSSMKWSAYALSFVFFETVESGGVNGFPTTTMSPAPPRELPDLIKEMLK